MEAPGIQLQQLRGEVFRFDDVASLKSCSGRSGLAIPGGGSDEFHHVQSDILIASCAYESRKRVHTCCPPKDLRCALIVELWKHPPGKLSKAQRLENSHTSMATWHTRPTI